MHSFEVLQSCKAYRQDRAKTQALECPSPIYSEVPHRVSGCLPVFCLFPFSHALSPFDPADFSRALPPTAFHLLPRLFLFPPCYRLNGKATVWTPITYSELLFRLFP